MTIRTLASMIAKLEGKKSQARIGDIREILKLIAVLEATHRVQYYKSGDFDYQRLSPVLMSIAGDAAKITAREVKRSSNTK